MCCGLTGVALSQLPGQVAGSPVGTVDAAEPPALAAEVPPELANAVAPPDELLAPPTCVRAGLLVDELLHATQRQALISKADATSR